MTSLRPHAPSIMSAAFSPIMIVGAFVFPPVTKGIDGRVHHAQPVDASHAQRRSSTESPSEPIRHVHDAW